MTDLEKTLSWLVYAGAVTFARKKWDQKLALNDCEAGRRDYAWDCIWSMQRAYGCPPIGAIRSV